MSSYLREALGKHRRGLLVALAVSAATAASNPRPVIGIMVQPLQPDVSRDVPMLKYGSMYLPSSYVKAVEAAGARAAPVLYNNSAASLRAQFAKLSGLLLPGGHVGHVNTSYATAVYTMLDLAGAGTFPVHGTCLGSQMLAQWASGDTTRSLLSSTKAEDLLLPLKPRKTAWDASWLLEGAPADVLPALTATNSTVNLHNYGVLPSLFESGGKLDTGVLRPLATSVGSDGVEFVALYEGVPPRPWSATQYHPEKNAFEFGGKWNTCAAIGDVHSDDAIEASAWLMRKLVQAARVVDHVWDDEDPTFPLMRKFAPVPGGPDAGFDWESCYFW